MDFRFLASIPMPGVFVGIVLLLLLSCEIGFRMGHYHQRKHLNQGSMSSIGAATGGLLAMLAFVLAIAFSMASSQQETRKQDVLNEANIIGTAYLRADLVGHPRGDEIKRLLREYVGVRLEAARPGGDVAAALRRSLEIPALLLADVSAAANENPNDITALAVEAINEVFDMHERRLHDAVRARIPAGVWLGLMVITVLSMVTVGLQVGLTGRRWLIVVLPLCLAFAVLVSLVVDLNRPQSGLMVVGQQAMLDLQESISPAQKP